MKTAWKMKHSSIFSTFWRFESCNLTSERRLAPFTRFHGKSGVSGPSVGFLEHQRRLGAFLKASEVKSAFHKARIQTFQVLINFLEFCHIFRFVAHTITHCKGARGFVHTWRLFLTFQMASSTYLDIKKSVFESARPTNRKGAVGIWKQLEKWKIHRFSQLFDDLKAVFWIQKGARRLLDIFRAGLTSLALL